MARLHQVRGHIAFDPLCEMLTDIMPVEVPKNAKVYSELYNHCYHILLRLMLEKYEMTDPDPDVIDLIKTEFQKAHTLIRAGDSVYLIDRFDDSANGIREFDMPPILIETDTEASTESDEDSATSSTPTGSLTPTSSLSTTPPHYIQQLQPEECYMSGALPCRGTRSAVFPHEPQRPRAYVHPCNDDALVCEATFERQVLCMPFRIMDINELQSYTILSDPATRTTLGDDFLTTPLGMRRAEMQVEEIMKVRTATKEDIIYALQLRGGRIPRELKNCQVVYPEDIEPDCDEYHSEFDAAYWSIMKSQGKVWGQVLAFKHLYRR